jgi:hypothetical protein
LAPILFWLRFREVRLAAAGISAEMVFANTATPKSVIPLRLGKCRSTQIAAVTTIGAGMNNTSTDKNKRKKGWFQMCMHKFLNRLPDNAIASHAHHHHHIHIAKDLRFRDFRQTFSTTTPTEAICDGPVFQSEGEVQNKQPMVVGA